MLRFKIKPYDVLFFGSGKPFNLGETAKSVFPPFPHTFAGAICAKIYQHYGIDTSEILKHVYGPFLYNDTKEKKEKLYFPKPADIYKERKKEKGELFFLNVKDDNKYSLFRFENTNKPNVKMLPIYIGMEDVGGFDGFISEDGLNSWINGDTVRNEDIKGFNEIFKYEDRVGIKINSATHSVMQEDGLYRIKFLRLKDGWSFVFYVEFNIEKLPKDLKDEEKLLRFYNSNKILKLGGEMRSVYYEVGKEDIKQRFKKPKINGNRFKLLFLSPGIFNGGNVIPKNICGFEVLSACISSFVNLAIKSSGLKINNFTKRGIRAGSVLYVEKKINEVNLDNYWFGFLKPYQNRNKKFIGSNLVIYGKI